MCSFLFLVWATCAAPPVAATEQIRAETKATLDAYDHKKLKVRPLLRYQQLIRESPHLFAKKGSSKHGELELILDVKRIMQVEDKYLQQYSKKMDIESAFVASRAGVILEDPYWIILREAVVFPDGSAGLFDRYVSTSSLDGSASGGFGLPILPNGHLLLVQEFRHQERTWRLGLPGGFRDPGETIDAAVRREVQEETNHHVSETIFLGYVDADFESTPVYICNVDASIDVMAHKESGEAISGVIELSLDAVKASIIAGTYSNGSGQTMVMHGPLAAAIMMLESRFPEKVR